MKLITAAKKAPQLITTGPIENVAVCQAPPGINGVEKPDKIAPRFQKFFKFTHHLNHKRA